VKENGILKNWLLTVIIIIIIILSVDQADVACLTDETEKYCIDRRRIYT